MKIIPFDKPFHYHESGQTNPLRWTILYKEEGENVFSEQAGLMKCKDYFNDLVAAYRGLFFTQYGFDNSSVKLNDHGVWFKLTGLFNKEVFIHNLGSINSKANEQGFPPLTGVVAASSSQAVLQIPKAFFECTYFLSLVTYLIRIANSETKFNSFDELVNKNENTSRDCPFGRYQKAIMDRGFKVPSPELEGRPYFAFQNKESDDKLTTQMGSYVHNNGCRDWCSKVETYDLTTFEEALEEVTSEDNDDGDWD